MTGKELYESVTRLGFSESLDDLENLFYEAVNLALSQLARLFPEETLLEKEVVAGNKYYTRVEGKSLDPRFLAFSSLPLYSGNTPMVPGRDYLLRGNALYIPREQTGKTLLFSYSLYPKRLTPDNMEEELSVEGQAEHLLPLFTASILWEQDDPELSNRYYSLYRNALGELRLERMPEKTSGLLESNGWDR